MKRVYHFKVPYRVGKLELTLFAARIVTAGIWDVIPRKLAIKINEALDSRTAVTLTQEDFDSIKDDVWVDFSKAVDLNWQTAPTQGLKCVERPQTQ
jgi:hypothetical protein